MLVKLQTVALEYYKQKEDLNNCNKCLLGIPIDFFKAAIL